MTARAFTALVLAASRRGADDPVARLQGMSHKCLVTLDGVAMVARVIDALRATPEIGRIFISIEHAQILAQIPALAERLARGEITVIESRATLADSVLAAIAAMDNSNDASYPLLITTADNALHTPEMIHTFCTHSRDMPCDVAVGMTAAATVLARYPSGQRAFHRFKDGAYSSCNIYILRNAKAATAARVFAGGGQFGKKPWRLIAAFGYGTFVRHMLRRLTLADAMARISTVLNITVRAILMPFAEAPMDVDNEADHALATEILRNRKAP